MCVYVFVISMRLFFSAAKVPSFLLLKPDYLLLITITMIDISDKWRIHSFVVAVRAYCDSLQQLFSLLFGKQLDAKPQKGVYIQSGRKHLKLK